jgi:Rrf2 family cysteine metabolism transcriptional repressor
MAVTQKTQYALRALLELAKREGHGPAKIGQIAEAQRIPPRFLEVILNELKQGGFAESRRGKVGGYYLAKPAQLLTVGEVIRFVQGPLYPAEAPGNGATAHAQPDVFAGLWQRVENALADVYDGTTLAQLVEEEVKLRGRYAPDFTI